MLDCFQAYFLKIGQDNVTTNFQVIIVEFVLSKLCDIPDIDRSSVFHSFEFDLYLRFCAASNDLC